MTSVGEPRILGRALQVRVSLGSGQTRWHVLGERTPNGLRLTCNCKAGRSGWVCEHRLILALGVNASLFTARGQVEDLLQLIADTRLPKAVRELVRLRKERLLIIDEIERQLQFVAELMAGGECSQEP